MIFIIMYMISFIMVINSDDWFLIWLGMEINMISFIFLIYYRNSMINVESCLKYFFIQSIGSAIFMSLFYLNFNKFVYLGSMVVVMKMGGGPFYFWFPSVCLGISWFSCFMMMIFQKIIPLVLLSYLNSWILWMMIMISLFMGALGSFNQVNMKMLLAYSSIHHMGWMIFCIVVEFNLWIIYLTLYTMIIFPFIWILKINDVSNLMDISKVNMKWLMIFLMINMGGLPPFLGFFLKWMSFYYMVNMNLLLIFMLILLSSLMFYVYIRICFMYFLGFTQTMMFSYNHYKMFYMSYESMLMLGLILGNMFMLMYFM